jgi:hypothetical protein
MVESSITDVESQAAKAIVPPRSAWPDADAGQTEAGRNWLRRAAESGPTDIKLALGEQLIANPPYEVAEALHWTHAAAEEGSAEAAHRLAVFAAEGVGEPQSWSDALIRLKQAAALGHRIAQAELAELAGHWQRPKALLTGGPVPAEADLPGDAIDLASWLRCRPRLISPARVSPSAFLSPVCDWLIERPRPNLHRAQIRSAPAARRSSRPNHSCWGFNVAQSDVVIAIVRARMAQLTGHSVYGFEDTSVLHYSPGEQFAPHYDFIEPNTQAALSDIASTGQRAVTFLAYLNDGYEGGETNFPRLGRSYKGTKGDALFYDNVLPADGSPDRRTLHTGTMLRRGRLLSQWIRSRPAWLKAVAEQPGLRLWLAVSRRATPPWKDLSAETVH